MLKNFQTIFKLICLDKKTIAAISKKETATIDGIIIIILGILASFIAVQKLAEKEQLSELQIDFDVSTIISAILIGVVFTIMLILVSNSIAKLMGGQGKFIEYFRVTAYSNIIHLLNIVPVLNILTLWYLVMNFQILKTIHKLNTSQALLTIFTTFLLIFALLVLLR